MIDMIQDQELGCVYVLERRQSGEYIYRVFEQFDNNVDFDVKEIERRIENLHGGSNGIYFMMGDNETEKGTVYKSVHVIRLGNSFPAPYQLEKARNQARTWVKEKRQRDNDSMMEELESFGSHE